MAARCLMYHCGRTTAAKTSILSLLSDCHQFSNHHFVLNSMLLNIFSEELINQTIKCRATIVFLLQSFCDFTLQSLASSLPFVNGITVKKSVKSDFYPGCTTLQAG